VRGAVRLIVVTCQPSRGSGLVSALEAESDISVVAEVTAADATAAVRKHRPDVVAVDLESPQRGVKVIERIMAFNPTPILVLSGDGTGAPSTTAIDALGAGALEAMPRPARWDAASAAPVRTQVRALRGVVVMTHPRGRLQGGSGLPVVALASSTGGPAALAEILPRLGGLRAAVLLVQHIHDDFMPGLMTWMDRVSALPVEMAVDGVRLREGWVYLAPTGTHLKLGPARRLDLDPKPDGLHRPSANELFLSVARHAGPLGVGVILTGMGDDGARGLGQMRQCGAATIAQDEGTSAVYGMPKAAIESGGAFEVVPLGGISRAICRAVERVLQ
jgi:two-component system chemotaxis response regulator CheB